MLNTLLKSASLLVASFSFAALAQEAAPTPPQNPLEINAKIFADYRYDATKDSAHKNGFEITRSWIGFNYKFDENWSSMLAFDSQRGETYSVTDSTTGAKSGIQRSSLDAYTRAAYVMRTCNCESHSWNMKFGLQGNPYFSTVESINGTRYIYKSVADDAKILASVFGGFSLNSIWRGGLLNSSLIVHNGREGINAAGDSDSGTAVALNLGTSYKFEGAGITIMAQSFTEKVDRAVEAADGTPVQAATTNRATAAAIKHTYAELTLESATSTPARSSDGKAAVGATLTTHTDDSKYGLFFRTMELRNKKGDVTVKSKSMAVGPTFALVEGGKISTALIYETAHVDSKLTGTTYAWKWQAQF